MFFREVVSGGAIAADADAEDSGTAALALCLEDAIEDRVLDALEIASAESRIGQRVLRVHVFAAAAFEHQLHFDMRLAPLMKMKNG